VGIFPVNSGLLSLGVGELDFPMMAIHPLIRGGGRYGHLHKVDKKLIEINIF
jgi:hypothetical protein